MSKIHEEYTKKMFDIALEVPKSTILVIDKYANSLYDNYLEDKGAITKYLKDHKYKGLKVNKRQRIVRFKNKSVIYFIPFSTERQKMNIAGMEITAFFMHNYDDIPERNRLYLRTRLRLGSLVIPEDNKYFGVLPKGFISDRADVRNIWEEKV